MKIPLYIRDLLLEGKNVAVAGFGTFECKKVAAAYDKENSLFIPPGRDVTFIFDENTKGTDFTFYVTERESVKIEQAQLLVEEAIDDINYQLHRGKRIKYTGLGTFQLDQQKNIVFEADTELLTGGEYFGLNAVPVAAYAKSKQSLGMKIFLAFLLIIGVGLVGYWGFIVWKMVDNQRHTMGMPIHLSSPDTTKVILTSPGQKALDSIREQITPTKPSPVINNSSASEKEETEEVKKPEPKKPEIKTNTSSKQTEPEALPGGKFYIVAGCFRSEEGARKFVGQLKAKGYSSELFSKTESGLNMVSYASFKTRAEADAELLRIRNDENKAAYIVNR